MSRLNPEWQDPTAREALANATTNRNKPTSISEFRDVPPLSKFENPADHKGRRRLLKALYKELEKAGKNNNANKRRIRDEIRNLSGQQFVSRVAPEEAGNFTGRKKRY